ncbi:leucine rich repeat variant [Streptomyces sp. XY413]|nr:leucine rich repeat variant [Streptomyces sp. XY413]
MNRLLCGLAANPALPPELVDRLIALAAAAPEPSAPSDPAGLPADYLADVLVRHLSERSDLRPAQVAALAALDEDTPALLARDGHLGAADVDPAVWPLAALALLDEGRGLPEWARRFAADPDPSLRRQLASCPGLPADVEDALAADADPEVAAELAWWTTSAPVADRLARHPHAEVRQAVAGNEAVPPVALAALLTGHGLPPALSCLVCDSREIPFTHDPYCQDVDCDLPASATCDGAHGSTVQGTWARALSNPAAPPEAVAGFAEDSSVWLRRAVAEHPGLPAEVYARLAGDPVPGIRASVAQNPGTGPEVSRVLAADPDVEVRRAVARHPRVPFDVLARLTPTTRLGPHPLPRISAATAEELAQAAASANARVRMLVAHRHDLPPELRDRLAADPDASVAKAVAPHPGLAPERLRAMVALHGQQVIARVAANPHVPGDLLAELARHEPPARRALREIASHPNATAEALLPCLADAKARVRAATHPALPAGIVVGLLDDPDPEVVEAAAGNPSLPPDVMAQRVP